MELLIPIALILVGLSLVAVEVTLLPGTNVVGVLGLIGAAVGVVVAFGQYGVLGGLGTLVGTLVAGGALAYVLVESGAWSKFVLTDSLVTEPDEDAGIRAAWIGETGTVVTPLRPEGVVEIGGTRVEARTEGTFVAMGSRVRVIAIDRRCAVVRLDAAD